jgi:hypothetical protein
MVLRKILSGKRMWPFSDMSLSTATRWFDVANLVLLGSLLFGILATFAIVRLGNVKEHHWDVLRDQSRERVAGLEAEAAKANDSIAEARKETAGANARALEAQLALERLKAPRTLGPERQQVVAAAAAPFAGQRYRAAISQGADDGLAFWESLYATLERAGWIYLPASMGMGNPTAGIPIAAIPGVEIRFDPAKREKLEAPALALGNALHANKMVVAVNVERKSNPNEAERDILTIVIGARVPPP